MHAGKIATHPSKEFVPGPSLRVPWQSLTGIFDDPRLTMGLEKQCEDANYLLEVVVERFPGLLEGLVHLKEAVLEGKALKTILVESTMLTSYPVLFNHTRY